MDIYSVPGTLVKFLGENGYEAERKEALNILKVRATYTVKYIAVHSWSSEVELEEFPNQTFNTVMFENLPGHTTVTPPEDFYDGY